MRVHSLRRTVLLLATLLLATIGAGAQTNPADTQSGSRPSSSTPQASATPSPEKQFFKNILRDQRAIWTSPFHLHGKDSTWLLPVGLSTAALVATDRHTAGALSDNRTRLTVSHDISYAGSTYGAGGIAVAFYLAGRASHNARAREAGLLGAEALIDSGIVSVALKGISQRPRPRIDDASGEFFDGGNSFPSGHALQAWSLATVIANEYKDHRFVQITAYGLAAAVSISRYTGRNHFLSDVLVGSALGYGIGHYVYKTHHDASLDETDGTSSSRKRSKLFPVIAPQYSGHVHLYGATLTWNM